jgi:AcrR family transcriptional regulator
MRRIARRAGVSHAALAYKFGDKAGIFTAVATEGFRLAAQMIGAATEGPDGFVNGGENDIAFTLTHCGYCEVMFRPNLYRGDDPRSGRGKGCRLRGDVRQCQGQP